MTTTNKRNMTIAELIQAHGLLETVNKYNLQIIHEDNDTFSIEDMKQRKTMTHGTVIHICKDTDAVINYLQNLRRA